jgi:integrase
MRRTCASLLVALDIHPRVTMRILRHSKIAVTMAIYTEVPDDSTRDAWETSSTASCCTKIKKAGR